jgi:DNA-binding LacI/PurR family transcriptional regulator
MMALGLIAGLRDHGLRVPEDMSVVGIDDLYLSSLFRPALTSVRQPLPAMARTMVERVIARLADPTIPVAEFLFEPEIMLRETVARPAQVVRTAPPRRSRSVA